MIVGGNQEGIRMLVVGNASVEFHLGLVLLRVNGSEPLLPENGFSTSAFLQGHLMSTSS